MNRKQRRAEEAVARKNDKPKKFIDATAKEPPQKIDPLGQAMEKRMDELANQERVRLIVSMQAPAPNEMVAYLVERYREARGAYDTVSANVHELKAKLEASKDKQLVLQGGVNKYLEDIVHWLEKDNRDKREAKLAQEGLEQEKKKEKIRKQLEDVKNTPDDPPPAEPILTEH